MTKYLYDGQEVSATEMLRRVRADQGRPWVSATDEVWVLGWDESVLLSGPIDEPDERTRSEIRVALAEAGLEVPADVQAVIDLHEETIYGPNFKYRDAEFRV